MWLGLDCAGDWKQTVHVNYLKGVPIDRGFKRAGFWIWFFYHCFGHGTIINLMDTHDVGGLILGFFAYGLSIYFYISAQRHLGAARTSAYYALAPFIGSLLSFIALQETINLSYTIAFMVMGIGTYFFRERKSNNRKDEIIM
jgi:drug/metabolite transporter (DMT)-like permease